MIDDSKDAAAAAQLGIMMDSIGRSDTWWSLGKMRCRKKLANGYVVTVSITEPMGLAPRPASGGSDDK